MVSMRSRRGSVDQSIPAEKVAAAVGGAKTIGLVGGIALLLNNITGSGMVLFPSLYQQAGWLLVSLALLGVCGLSYICSVMIIEAMAAMPGNAKFDKRVEYTSLAYFYLGKYGYGVTQLFFQLSLACNNISSIIQSVQVMDFALAAIFGKSCATPEFYPSFAFHCPDPVSGDITVFGDGVYVLSIGFILTALLCAPLGFWNLDDNIIIQKVSCLLVFVMVAIWFGVFVKLGFEVDRLPTVGTQFTGILGTVLFNFAVITSIPSWVNEKKEEVGILTTMSVAMPLALGLFTVTGLFGGLAFEPWFNGPNSDETLLTKMKESSLAIAHVTFYLFPVIVNLTSIPVFAIMQRYNLLEANVCGPRMANFLGVILPWLLCVPFYTGSGFSIVVSWGGVIFNSAVNFIIPPIIYIAMVRRQQAVATKHMVNDLLLLSDQPLSDSVDPDGDALYEDDGKRGYQPPTFQHDDAITGEQRRSSSVSNAARWSPGSSALDPPSVSAPARFLSRVMGTSPKAAVSKSPEYEMRPSSRAGPRAGTSASGSAAGSFRPISPLARSPMSASPRAELAQSLLGSSGAISSYAAESGLYTREDVDVRSPEEEAAETRIMGYNPFEAAREEELKRELAVREAAAALKKKHKQHVTLAVPSIGDPALHINYSADRSEDGSTVHVMALPSDSEHSASPPAAAATANLLSSDSSFMVLGGLDSERWQAMPAWLLPHRILLGKSVAITLTLIAITIVIINTIQCATGQGCS